MVASRYTEKENSTSILHVLYSSHMFHARIVLKPKDSDDIGPIVANLDPTLSTDVLVEGRPWLKYGPFVIHKSKGAWEWEHLLATQILEILKRWIRFPVFGDGTSVGGDDQWLYSEVAFVYDELADFPSNYVCCPSKSQLDHAVSCTRSLDCTIPCPKINWAIWTTSAAPPRPNWEYATSNFRLGPIKSNGNFQ
ncbi:hypothetical protein VNO77_19660 [Canavalia gladiata]|uniref:Uncharacterized protein n=1 Tax=Canavalia gladiata TaxID=3824 RepID=A0AAN9QLM8_CANGL